MPITIKLGYAQKISLRSKESTIRKSYRLWPNNSIRIMLALGALKNRRFNNSIKTVFLNEDLIEDLHGDFKRDNIRTRFVNCVSVFV